MKWRCNLCGFKIKKREDRRKVNIKNESVYILGYCDNCHNWTILKRLPIDKVKGHIKETLLD